MHAQVHDPDHLMDWSVQICKADESAARAVAPGGPEDAEALATDPAGPAGLELNPPLPFKV